ncbi:MAG: DUF3303 domain-containing protein [Gammaproteobacteria bacterium]|nr:DUF3303 domain-containing protein [Gammaproteobacteria bacterium]
MAQYMVIEKFFDNCTEKVYERFRNKGRMLPEGLNYLDSWLTKDGTRCFQLMETERHELFLEWMEKWNDLTHFEIIEIGDKPEKPSNR